MNKAEIKTVINELGLKNEKYFIYMSGALVIMNIKESANDLDIGITDRLLFEDLKERYNLKEIYSLLNDKKIELKINNFKIEIFLKEDDYDYNRIDGIKCQKLSDIIDMKQKLGRRKDIDDLEIINDFRNNINNKLNEKDGQMICNSYKEELLNLIR